MKCDIVHLSTLHRTGLGCHMNHFLPRVLSLTALVELPLTLGRLPHDCLSVRLSVNWPPDLLALTALSNICLISRPGHSLRHTSLILYHLRNLQTWWRRNNTDSLICWLIKKPLSGPVCTHIKWYVIYLLYCRWRFLRCYKIKVVCWRLCPGLLISWAIWGARWFVVPHPFFGGLDW